MKSRGATGKPNSAPGAGTRQPSRGLDEMLAYARRVVTSLTPEDLTRQRTAYTDGRTMPVGACLLHVVRHTALHAGHMQITRQLWERRGPG